MNRLMGWIQEEFGGLESFIKKQAQEGKTVLLSSHILSEVEAVTDDVVIINKGKVLIKGTLQEVMKIFLH